MLTHVEISNYKSIAHADLSFSSETVIVGQNGVGKSNLLDALHFVRDAARDGLDHAITRRHGIESIRRWSKTRPYNISIRLVFCSANNNGEYKLTISSGGGNFNVLEEEASWTSMHPFAKETDGPTKSSFRRHPGGIIELEIPDNPFENSMKSLSARESELVLTQFNSNTTGPLSFFFSGLYEEISSFGAYSIYPNKIREPQTISNADVLADDGTNLASIIRQMRSSTASGGGRESLTNAIRQVLPFVTEIQIKSAGGFYVPVFRVKEPDNGHSHELNMSQISDGTLRMLGMLTAFYQPRAPSKIALEEPEQMIHPGLLPVLLDSARDYLEARAGLRQIFMTTHSPTLLDLFEPESLIGARFEAGVSKFNRLSARQMKVVKDRLYTAGELLIVEGIVA